MKRVVGVIGTILVYFLTQYSISWAYIDRASWYESGHTTANGESYDKDGFTAAHRTLPIDAGILVKVTNLRNGQSVIVRINDRGPYVSGRRIDLSYGAAKRIGLVRNGVDQVNIEILNAGAPFYSYEIGKNPLTEKCETLWGLFDHKWPIVAQINKISPEKIKVGDKIWVPYNFNNWRPPSKESLYKNFRKPKTKPLPKRRKGRTYILW